MKGTYVPAILALTIFPPEMNNLNDSPHPFFGTQVWFFNLVFQPPLLAWISFKCACRVPDTWSSTVNAAFPITEWHASHCCYSSSSCSLKRQRGWKRKNRGKWLAGVSVWPPLFCSALLFLFKSKKRNDNEWCRQISSLPEATDS